MALRVMLVEDHPVVLRGLRAITTEQDDLEVVGTAATVAGALETARAVRPDVVVLPVRIEGTYSGVELCRALKAESSARVVVFTSFTRSVDIQVALLAGADALVGKTVPEQEFVAALRGTVPGGGVVVLGGRPRATVPIRTAGSGLTTRERNVLQLVIEGLTNPDIAVRLSIEVTTVRTHVRSILRKLGVETRRDLFRSGEG